jgi:thiol-disulfide isomerase/thioredoxin
MKTKSGMILRLLGLLLLAAACLKGWQLITEPVANKGFWANRTLLIGVVEFELALAIWLMSGMFRKVAWLAAVVCFCFFSCVTLYKGVTGADSCGCFGAVKVNPWVTLLAVDLPAVAALLLFRPAFSFPKSRSVTQVIRKIFTPAPSIFRLSTLGCVTAMVLGVSTAVLALNEPVKVTSSYEVLEPETWIGKKLPIIDSIDIGEQLKTGNWLILFYHYDCPDCRAAISKLEQLARDLAGNENFPRIAFVAVPPYGDGPVHENSPCALGRLADVKEWFVTTPAVILMNSGIIKRVLAENNTPDPEAKFSFDTF